MQCNQCNVIKPWLLNSCSCSYQAQKNVDVLHKYDHHVMNIDIRQGYIILSGVCLHSATSINSEWHHLCNISFDRDINDNVCLHNVSISNRERQDDFVIFHSIKASVYLYTGFPSRHQLMFNTIRQCQQQATRLRLKCCNISFDQCIKVSFHNKQGYWMFPQWEPQWEQKWQVSFSFCA